MDDKIKYKINHLVCKGLSNAIYIEILLSMFPSGLKTSLPPTKGERVPWAWQGDASCIPSRMKTEAGKVF